MALLRSVAVAWAFARIRREQRTLQQSRQKIEAESLLKVRLLRQKAV